MAKKQIAKAAGIILLGTIIGKITGFLQQVLIARYFGASLTTDAYLVAYNIPMLFMGMILAGGTYSALVPIFTKYLALKEDKIFWRLFSIIISYTIIISVGMVVVIIIFAPYLVKLMGYGLGQEAFELAVKLTRIMAPMVIFLGLLSILIGVLHSFQQFTVPSFNALILGTTVILFIVLLGKNIGIYSVGSGLVVGSGFMFLSSLIVLIRKEVNFRFNLKINYPEVKEFMYLLIPATAGAFISGFYVIVNRMMASPLPVGSIASLDFGYMLVQASLSTFSLAISTAIFPFIASYAANKDYDSLKGTMSKGIRMTILIYLPVGLIFMVLCQPIIRLLFERGNFDTHDTIMTSQSLFFYAIGLIGLAVNYVLVRVFYALHDSITPLISTIAGILLHIALNIILIKYLAHAGIAFSASISHILTNLILIWCLRRKIGHIGGKQICWSFLKMSSAILPGTVVCWLVSNYLELVLDTSKIQFQIIQVGGATTIGLGFYLIILWLLKTEELKMIMELIKSKSVVSG